MPSKDHESSELDCWHPKIKQYGIKYVFFKMILSCQVVHYFSLKRIVNKFEYLKIVS